jgi:hypothetical protein
MSGGVRTGILACAWITTTMSSLRAAPVVTAEFQPPPGLSSGFSTGAGMGIDPPAPNPFDNRLAQTFEAIVAGRPATASLIVIRPLNTNAPLWVDIVTMSGGQVASVFASGSLAPAAFSTGPDPDPFQFNATVPLTATGALIAGEEYAMVLRSATPDANYRVYGTSQVNYDPGDAFRSQNSLTFDRGLSGDLFFRVTVEPVPEPAGIALFACVLTGTWRLRRLHPPVANGGLSAFQSAGARR